MSGIAPQYVRIAGPLEVSQSHHFHAPAICSCGVIGRVECNAEGVLAPSTAGGPKKCRGCAKRTHGSPPERRIWRMMHTRCEDTHYRAFARYGGRGIRVAERWSSYDAFIADMGPRPSDAHELDRIDNDGNYEPGNVRWATRAQQTRNTSVNRRLTFRGETMCQKDWANRMGISESSLMRRLRLGWTVERALTEPAVLGSNQYRKAALPAQRGSPRTNDDNRLHPRTRH